MGRSFAPEMLLNYQENDYAEYSLGLNVMCQQEHHFIDVSQYSFFANRGIPTIMGESVVAEITTDGCAGTSAEVRYLEHVQARVSLRFLPRGNINIKLISPSGTFKGF